MGETSQRREKHAVVRRRTGCRQLFILFSGAQGRFLMPPAEFLVKTGLDRRNIIMLSDTNKAFYQLGISSEVDSFPALVDWLATTRDEMKHVDEVYCFGVSMGAYAAILGGGMLGADAVYTAGPMTRLSDTRLAQRNELLDKVDLPDAHTDLRKYLAVHNGKTQYYNYFCKGCEEDAIRVKRIAGLPGVHLHPVPGRKHAQVLGSLEYRGQLATLFPPYREADGTPA